MFTLLFLNQSQEEKSCRRAAVNSHISRLESVVRYGAPESVTGPALDVPAAPRKELAHSLHVLSPNLFPSHKSEQHLRLTDLRRGYFGKILRKHDQIS